MRGTLTRVLIVSGIGLMGITTGRAQQAADVDRPAYWGTPTVDGGQCCQSLREVRSNIDRIDRELVRLMAERGRYVHEAARFKENPAAVEDPQRAEAVVQKAMRLAGENGLDASIAEAAYRSMMAAFLAYERRISAGQEQAAPKK